MTSGREVRLDILAYEINAEAWTCRNGDLAVLVPPVNRHRCLVHGHAFAGVAFFSLSGTRGSPQRKDGS